MATKTRGKKHKKSGKSGKSGKSATNSSTSFTCRADDASEVSLVGTFNDWNPSTTPMQRRSDGAWAVDLDLPSGRYEFKFVVDEQWCCDPHCEDGTRSCHTCVPNAFGSMNRFIDIA